jgi:hypothetical protein
VVKGADCKSAMRRFESARRLHSSRVPRRRVLAWLAAERPAPWVVRRRRPLIRGARAALIQEALEFRDSGNATAAISRELGVPRSTIRYWLERYAGVAQSAEAAGLKSAQWGFESLHQHQLPAYAYLLGMYLGDGHIAHHPRAYALRIFLNRKQVDVIERVCTAIRTLRPHNRVNCVSHHQSVVAVTCYSRDWPRVFPQHGPGRKHTRPIVLENWQQEIVGRCPEEFIRGCIESDGCRHRRIVNGRNYPAYAFSNRSDDIRRLFTEACDLLSIRWRQANRWQISIARRDDVARLDSLFAPGIASLRSI